jgi:hypothetical protein
VAKGQRQDTSLRKRERQHRLTVSSQRDGETLLAGNKVRLLHRVVTRGEGANNAAKLVRACGGCLGTRRRKGVEDCEKSGGVVKRALIPEYPS